MKVSEAMTREVCIASPEETIQKAAQLMAGLDTGVLPVGDGGRLLGMITDRDIVVRGLAEGLEADALVGEVMTPEVKYCFEDQDVAEVCRNMSDLQIRRLPVVDRDKRLVGILSLGDIATTSGDGSAGGALSGICRPGGARSQSASGL